MQKLLNRNNILWLKTSLIIFNPPKLMRCWCDKWRTNFRFRKVKNVTHLVSCGDNTTTPISTHFTPPLPVPDSNKLLWLWFRVTVEPNLLDLVTLCTFFSTYLSKWTVTTGMKSQFQGADSILQWKEEGALQSEHCPHHLVAWSIWSISSSKLISWSLIWESKWL